MLLLNNVHPLTGAQRDQLGELMKWPNTRDSPSGKY